jgi:predicted SAM-dependent methyltransferase
MMLLNAGCGTHYAKGWVNTDVWESDTTKPDFRVEPGAPYPFDDNTFDAIFMGHVLEHIDWFEVPNFLNDMSRIAKPSAPMMVIGPDVYKTIQRWSQGNEPWWMVESVMEHQDINLQPGRGHEWWDGATHHWNCHEQRVVSILETLGFENVEILSEKMPHYKNGWKDEIVKKLVWPTVQTAPWQFAVRFTNFGTS